MVSKIAAAKFFSSPRAPLEPVKTLDHLCIKTWERRAMVGAKASGA